MTTRSPSPRDEHDTLLVAENDRKSAEEADEKPKSKLAALREGVVLVVTAVLLYYLVLTFVARPYLIPSESMEPTLHGCSGCVGRSARRAEQVVSGRASDRRAGR